MFSSAATVSFEMGRMGSTQPVNAPGDSAHLGMGRELEEESFEAWHCTHDTLIVGAML